MCVCVCPLLRLFWNYFIACQCNKFYYIPSDSQNVDKVGDTPSVVLGQVFYLVIKVHPACRNISTLGVI